jgi:hypothetical protein
MREKGEGTAGPMREEREVSEARYAGRICFVSA